MFSPNYKHLYFNKYCQQGFSLFTSLSLFLILGTKIVQAQSITIDGSTNTSIEQTINQYNIGDGENAGNNIFHSFEEFGLTPGEIANFLSGSDTENIFGRVTGGDVSIINGLLKITGGTPNLFFINPAGIIFGENSSINVPASFTATTANGIQIGEFWFDALGENTYENLVGDPSSFAFLGANFGNIINLGNINVGVIEDLSLNSDGLLIDAENNVISDTPAQNPGETINLAGGLVINTGRLKTPGGTINIVAVPNQQSVRITPEGGLLSLVLPTEAATSLQPGIDEAGLTAPSLAELLTGGGITEASAIAVVDGVIRLTGNDTEIPSDLGTAIASGDIDTSNDIDDGGNININGEKVGILQSNLDASGSNGGTITISSEGVGIEEFSNSSRILIDSNSIIRATGIEDASEPGTGGEIAIKSSGAIAFDGRLSDSETNIATIDVSGEDATVEIRAKNNIVNINNDNELDFYIESLSNTLNLESLDNITLESNAIAIVGEDSNLGAEAVVNADITINNLLTAETIPTETTVIPVDSLPKVENVIIETSNTLTVARDILVSTGDDNAQFIGSLIESENINSDSASNIPLEDIPIFQNLTLRVDPPTGEIGSLDIQGAFAVTNDLLLENTNGNIIIEPQLPEFINFTNDPITTKDSVLTTRSSETLQYTGSNGGLFIGLDSLLSGVEPHGELRDDLGSATINARQGSVELLKGITLNSDTDLNLTAQQFIGSGTTTLMGNGPNGEPGRIESEITQTYTIGIVSFGGVSLDETGQPIFDEAGDVQLSEDSSPDPEPTLQFVVAFNPDNPNLIQPEAIVIAGDESTDATGDVEISLIVDQPFVVGEFDPDSSSGIDSIATISRISTNGSLVGNFSPIEETSLSTRPVSPEIPEIPTVPETPEIPAIPETPTVSEAPEIPTIPETPKSRKEQIYEILETLGLDFEQLTESSSSSIAKIDSSSNVQSQQQLATSNEISLDIESESDSEVANEAEQDASTTESTTEQSDSTATNSTSSTSNSTDSSNSGDQTSGNIDSQTDNNPATRRETSSNGSSSSDSSWSSSSDTESNNNSDTQNIDSSANQASNNSANPANNNTASEVNSNSTDSVNSSSTNNANSNAASEANSNSTNQASSSANNANSNSANQANSNSANQANSSSTNNANSNAASEANSNAANEANSNAADQANSNAVNVPASEIAPLPQNHLDPLSGLEDDSKVALLQEEPEAKLDRNPIKDWALPIAGGLLLTGGVGAVIANALFGNTIGSTLGNLLNSLGNNPTKPKPNNSQNKSDQNNSQQDTEIEMESTMKPGIMQLSEFPILDFEISLEMEPDLGTQIIHIKNNFVDHDRVKVKSE